MGSPLGHTRGLLQLYNFPHHESEIAQAECAGREPFARWWFHTAMVQHAGKKISKSLGNLVMLRDLLQTYSPDALRLYLAGHHYRQVWQDDPVELERAERLRNCLKRGCKEAGTCTLSGWNRSLIRQL